MNRYIFTSWKKKNQRKSPLLRTKKTSKNQQKCLCSWCEYSENFNSETFRIRNEMESKIFTEKIKEKVFQRNYFEIAENEHFDHCDNSISELH